MPDGQHVVIGSAPKDVSDDPDDVVDSWRIVAAVQAGDTDAFGRLYRRYARFVKAYVMGRTRDAALADDVTSATFLRALQRIHSLEYRGRNFRAWLITVARNLVLDHARNGAAHHEYPLEGFRDELFAAPDAADAVLRHAQFTELLQRVQDLPPAQRECLTLRFWHDLSVAETAARMRKKATAVRALQYRAVRSLARELRFPYES